MSPNREVSSPDDSVWIPVTVYLPLGFSKPWSPSSCLVPSMGPFVIIFFAQLANTVLVPVLPFLITDIGADPVAYGALQSAYWIAEMVGAPVLGYLSDYIGKKPVIFIALVISAISHGLLAMSTSLWQMIAIRVLCGLGFQVALFRAYFADTTPKHKRTGSFGLIGVITGIALTFGPTIGGTVSKAHGTSKAVWTACGLCSFAALVTFQWRENSKPQNKQSDDSSDNNTPNPNSNRSIKWVKIDLKDQKNADSAMVDACSQSCHRDKSKEPSACAQRMTKMIRLSIWLGQHKVYPLLAVNIIFRFGFSSYKSIFAYYCKAQFGFGPAQVGYMLSFMGVLGIVVQGVIIRVVVRFLPEDRTLQLSLFSIALGMIGMSMTNSVVLLVCFLVLITVGYGLAVPTLSTLFSHVPMPQGVMQGIAGSVDRLGQVLGPMVGLQIMKTAGEAATLWHTGLALSVMTCVWSQFRSPTVSKKDMAAHKKPMDEESGNAHGRRTVNGHVNGTHSTSMVVEAVPNTMDTVTMPDQQAQASMRGSWVQRATPEDLEAANRNRSNSV